MVVTFRSAQKRRPYWFCQTALSAPLLVLFVCSSTTAVIQIMMFGITDAGVFSVLSRTPQQMFGCLQNHDELSLRGAQEESHHHRFMLYIVDTATLFDVI